jgi:aminodeoxyfutalosine deaminase
MILVSPDYLFTPKGFLKDHCFVFETKILWIGKCSELPKEYETIETLELPENSCITPGLINSHVHLEFSKNKTSLKFGRFLPWLYSVIKHRDEIVGNCKEKCMEEAIASMIQSGTTAFGAVSSYGTDMTACVNTPAKVVFYNELIGSNATMADTLWGDFLGRLDDSKKHKSSSFQPAVAVHSPYAVHPILVKRAISIAKNEKLPVTAHLLESPAEREWLDNNEGEFAPFFDELLKQKIAVTKVDEFIESFDETPTTFTHATQLNDSELKKLEHKNHTIIHCPISNRLLGSGVLDIKALYEHNIPYVCGTDGMSSNYSLDLLEELKAALYMHNDADLDTLALSLLHSVTTVASQQMSAHYGEIKEGFDADFLLFDLGKEVSNEEDIALHIILKNHPLSAVYISGSNQKDS